MTTISIIALVMVFALLAGWFGKGGELKAKLREEYRRKDFLLNKSELALYNGLKDAAPAMLVFSQVSMSQVFNISRTGKNGYRQIGEIGRKSIDFLLCHEDTSIAIAVELNGPTHQKNRQRKSDDRKSTALKEAGIPLIIISADRIPTIDELRKMIGMKIVESRHAAEEVRKEPIF